VSEVCPASAAACEATGQHGEVKAAPSGAGPVHQRSDHCHAPECQMGSGTWQLQGKRHPCMPTKVTSRLCWPQLDCNPHSRSNLLHSASVSKVRHLAKTVQSSKGINKRRQAQWLLMQLQAHFPAQQVCGLYVCPAHVCRRRTTWSQNHITRTSEPSDARYLNGKASAMHICRRACLLACQPGSGQV
jgi:hypothetical protein